MSGKDVTGKASAKRGGRGTPAGARKRLAERSPSVEALLKLAGTITEEEAEVLREALRQSRSEGCEAWDIFSTQARLSTSWWAECQ